MDDRFKALEKYNLWNGMEFPIGYKRQEYLDKILSYTGNRLIKVLVGQRRVGKSYILRQLASHFADNGVNPQNIFFINCELTAFNFLNTYEDLNAFRGTRYATGRTLCRFRYLSFLIHRVYRSHFKTE